MKKISVLTLNSCEENIRNRFYLVAVIFVAVFLYISLMLGVLAVEQEPRVLSDFGLALIELMGLAAAVYGACTTVLREMETKTIYLILSRPVSRSGYLLGRFLGLLLSVGLIMVLMSAFHLLILFSKGWAWQWAYAQALAASYLKVAVCASLALFLALFSSSAVTAGIIAAVLWTLGHFIPEITGLIAHSLSRWAFSLKALSYLIPNLNFFNYRDNLSQTPTASALGSWLAYAFLYGGTWFLASLALFRRKDF